MQTALDIHAGNLVTSLRQFVFTPAEAVCAIVDNAIDAGARNINLFVTKRKVSALDTLRNNVSEYLIIDDGRGMDEAGIQNALTLGASDAAYAPHSLSKFGLGLKSAAFSQGDELDVISSIGGDCFRKYRVSLPAVEQTGRYFAEELPLSADDNELVSRYLPGGQGTVIRVGQVRKEGHPSIKHTIEQLKRRIGIIYYYFLADESLTISLENTLLPAFDVLFAAEADTNGKLDENTWNGRETRWIQQPLTLLLDSAYDVSATVEVTQMPHPPTYSLDGHGEQTASVINI